MSRIGKLPITIPAGVTVDYNNKIVTVKGPNGTLSQEINSKDLDIKIDGAELNVVQKDGIESKSRKDANAKHGLYRQLINNMVTGVVTPYKKTLIVKGVGYKTSVNGKKLVMNIGYSHPVEYVAPEGITITCQDATTIVVTGINKELVGHAAATIKSKRPVEPYHNYGIHYAGEKLVKKEGKTAGK